MKKLFKRVAVGAGLAVASVGAFAQASTVTISDSSIVTQINSVGSILVDVGGAVIGIVAVAWGYRMVKGFIGR